MSGPWPFFSISRFRTIISACVYDLPFLFFPFCLLLPCRPNISRSGFTLHKHARRSTGASLFLLRFYGKMARNENEEKKTNNACTESQILTVSLSDFPSLLSIERTEKPSPRRYDMRDTYICVFYFFLTFLSLFLLSPPLSLLI